MTTAEDQKRYDDAHEKGRQARRSGRKRPDNPYRGSTKLVRDLHQQWDLGWLAEDADRRGIAA